MAVLNLIGGEWTAASRTLDELDPSTGDVLLSAPRSDASDVAAAVGAARDAAAAWAATPPPSRGDVLFRAADAVASQAAALADAMIEEVGKPRREAEGEVARTVAILRYFAGEGRRAGGDVLPSDTGDLTLTLRQPLGVAGLITPWNFPLAIPAWKLGPALVSGNAVVLKPAEEAVRMAVLLARCLVDAGVPSGVLNLVSGDAEAGRALVEHPDVDAVSFTGSAAAGADVRAAAARRGVRCQLEMGGKNVAVVCADADLERAAAQVAAGAFAFGGQKCTATGLTLVEREVAGAFGAALRTATEDVVIGAPSDASTVSGPVIRADAVDRAVALGAERAGDTGFFVKPVVRSDARLGDPVATDELFVPVLPVVAVDDLDEAFAAAASLPTGLSAAIHTNRQDVVLRFLRELRAGVLAVNRPTTGLEVQAPFGGLKASGSEHKEQGAHAVDFYTETKTVYWTG